jgi:hypothetical protein
LRLRLAKQDRQFLPIIRYRSATIAGKPCVEAVDRLTGQLHSAALQFLSQPIVKLLAEEGFRLGFIERICHDDRDFLTPPFGDTDLFASADDPHDGDPQPLLTLAP